MDTNLPVLYREADHIAYITLNAPERRNSLTADAVDLLSAAWRQFENSSARVAILFGAGGYFCAGLDLESVPDPAPAVPGIGADVSKPVIAAVSGPAVGLGLTLTVQADIAIADDTAFFQYPEGQVGFTGGLIAGLAARVPTKIVNEIVLLGGRIKPERAVTMGLINDTVPADELQERTNQIGQAIASSAPLVINALKAEILEVLPASPAQSSAQFRARMARIATSADRTEGLAAFRQKRRPEFTGN